MRTRPDPAKKRLGTGELVPDWKNVPPWWDPVNSSPLRDLPKSTTRVVVDPLWMARSGVIVVDRGPPVVPWVCSITVGNHTMYKNQAKTGGYPYLLARGWSAIGWREGTTMAASSVKIPGSTNMYWIPGWALPEYMRMVSRVWDSFALSIYDVCVRRPQRYASLKEAHRRWNVMPWIRRTLTKNYPHPVILADMGYPRDRKEHIKTLTTQAMANYPSPAELMEGVWASRPWILPAAEVAPTTAASTWWHPKLPAATRNRKIKPPSNPPQLFTMWDHQRANTMALDAADKHWYQLRAGLSQVISWLTVNPRTGRYDVIRPVARLKILMSRNTRLRTWSGPGADATMHAELETALGEVLNAGQALNKSAPDNPWRLYYRMRLQYVLKQISTREYSAAVKAWWRTGDPGKAPAIPPVPPYNKP